MAEPFVKEFDFVLDPDDFNSFCDELIGIFNIENNEMAAKEGIEAIRKTGNLPMMGRGTKTEKFFKRWNVKTPILGVVKRGAFQKLMDEISGVNVN